MEEIVRIRGKLLALRREARELAYSYASKYAKQHLLEIDLLLGQCVIQWDYAQLANDERMKRGS